MRMLKILLLLGIMDAGYLTYEHFFPNSELCHWSNPWLACGRVLDGPYSQIGPIPLALLGFLHYIGLAVWYFGWQKTSQKLYLYLLHVQSGAGLVVSGYLVYLQAMVIQTFCVYCLASAGISLLIFALVWLYSDRPGPKQKAPRPNAS